MDDMDNAEIQRLEIITQLRSINKALGWILTVLSFVGGVVIYTLFT